MGLKIGGPDRISKSEEISSSEEELREDAFTRTGKWWECLCLLSFEYPSYGGPSNLLTRELEELRHFRVPRLPGQYEVLFACSHVHTCTRPCDGIHDHFPSSPLLSSLLLSEPESTPRTLRTIR